MARAPIERRVFELTGVGRWRLKLAAGLLVAASGAAIAMGRGGSPSMWLVALCFASLAWLLYEFVVSRHFVVVGLDGVRVVRGFARRYVPYSVIEKVELATEGQLRVLSVRPAGEQPVHLLRAPEGTAATQEIKRTLEATWRAATAGPQLPRQAQRLVQRAHDGSRWLRSLRELIAGGAYRSDRVSTDDLVAVATDPGAPLPARLAASVAVMLSSERRHGRRLLRTLAMNMADPNNRRAILRIAAARSDAALARALDAVVPSKQLVATERQ